MTRKLRFFLLSILLPLLLGLFGLHSLALAGLDGRNSNSIGLQTGSCDVPSGSYSTIQSAVDAACDVINLTANLYVENIQVVGRNVTIIGQGPSNTIIDGGMVDRVFWVESNSSLTLVGLSVTNGYTDAGSGGGIYNRGTTNLMNTVVVSNSIDDDPGGGIYSWGVLNVEDSWILNNSARQNSTASDGGGVHVRGTAHFTSTVISGNVANTGAGIAVMGFMDDTFVTMVDSQIVGNDAFWGGGIIINDDASFVLYDSLVSQNEVFISGGGILNGGDMQIWNSQIVDNVAGVMQMTSSCGGGILNSSFEYSTADEGNLLIENSEIRGNRTSRDGAGICNGGADAILEVKKSLIVDNFMDGPVSDEGGGIYSDSDVVVMVENSTIANNMATIEGGAISAANLKMVNVTVSQNDAPDGGGVYSWGDVQMQNSIIAGNLTGGDCSMEASAVLTSLGHNIAGDSSCNLIAAGDMANTDPLLAPLSDNGGPTMTMALMFGSPALDTADIGACPGTDQRGILRPQGPGCDIGAYEYQVVVPVPPLFLPVVLNS